MWEIFCLKFHLRFFHYNSYEVFYQSFSELEKLDSTKLIKSHTKTTGRYKGVIVNWPWYIKCGICGTERQMNIDRKLHGRIAKFRSGKTT